MGKLDRHSFRAAATASALLVALIGLMICSTIQTEANQPGRLWLAAKDKKAKAPAANPVVVIETSKGVIKVQVFQNEAPITAGNFLDLVRRGFYNGLTFHRHVPGFVIQGGDPTGTGTGGFVDPASHQTRNIPLEVKDTLRHDSAGMLAMARSGEPDSASSQFYITLGPASWLDGKYAVFGRVIDGMPVVQQLRQNDKMTKVYEAESSK